MKVTIEVEIDLKDEVAAAERGWELARFLPNLRRVTDAKVTKVEQ